MNILKTGSDWLMGVLTEKVATTVAIRRASAKTPSVTATVGSSQHQQEGDLGIVYWESRDYLIDAASYAFGGTASEPRHGDLIEETQGGVTHTYEVMGDSGTTAWRWSDDYRNKFRIHTKRVKVSG